MLVLYFVSGCVVVPGYYLFLIPTGHALKKVQIKTGSGLYVTTYILYNFYWFCRCPVQVSGCVKMGGFPLLCLHSEPAIRPACCLQCSPSCSKTYSTFVSAFRRHVHWITFAACWVSVIKQLQFNLHDCSFVISIYTKQNDEFVTSQCKNYR